MKTLACVAALLVGLAAGAARGQDDEAQAKLAAARRAAADAFTRAADAAGQAEHLLVAPGVIADRNAKTVTLFGWSTDVKNEEAVEFFAIHDDSGKDYESLAVVTAMPGDVRKAIEFIGVSPGRPIDYGQLRFWPKGERMTLTFQWSVDGKATSARATELVWDRENKQALPDTGLAFTGSYYYQDFAGERKLAADTLDTRGIAATYNDPESLLTVPWQASQGDVYGQYIPHPDRRPPDYTPLTLTLQPLDGGKARLIELKLSITADPQGRLHFALTDAQGRRLNADTGVAGFTRAAAELVEQRRDPFVTVTPGDGVTIAQMKEAADLLGSIDKFTGIRVEPPAEGHLFYRAFTPEPKWRQRDERLFHGWEVHIDTGAGRQPTATLYDVTDDRDADGLTIIRETKYQPDTPAALAKIIEDADGARPRDIYVFIDGTATYGTLRRTLADVIDTHNVVLVYTNR